MEYRFMFSIILHIIRTLPTFTAAVLGFLEAAGVEWLVGLVWCLLAATTLGFIAPFILWVARCAFRGIWSILSPLVHWIIRSTLECLIKTLYYIIHQAMTLFYWKPVVNIWRAARLKIYDLLGVPELVQNDTTRGRCCGVNSRADEDGQYRCTEVGTLEIGRGKFCRRHTAQGRARHALESANRPVRRHAAPGADRQ